MNNSFFNSAELIRSIIRWKKHLLLVGLISLGASILFSSPWFIKPKFKSFALVYPSNLIAYSTESATEQMLQLAQSSDIREKVIHDFDLYKHYDVDTLKNAHFRTDVVKMYEENVTIKKTEYESMEITVLDENPIIASNIVDSIIHFFDVKARQLQAEKSAEVMVNSKNQLDQKLAQMDSMEERLRKYRTEYGILDYKDQSKEAIRGYLRGLSGNNSRATTEAKSMMDALRDKGGEFNALNEHLWRVRGTYNDLKLVYENAARDVTKKLTYANVVSRPQPSDKKAYPIRWLIVLISVGSSLFLAFMILLIFNSRQELSK